MDRMRKRESCDILGVPYDADDDMIKRAYKRLALEHHPDRPTNKGREQEAAELFNRINVAYEQLSNNNNTLNILKSAFKTSDLQSSLEHFFFTTGHNVSSFNLSQNSRSGSFNRNSSSAPPVAPSPQQPATPPPPPKVPKSGQSLQTTLHITFFESLIGCTKIIEYNQNRTCDHCSGNAVAVTHIECKDCTFGSIKDRDTSGSLTILPCNGCNGTGVMQKKIEACINCNGKGRTARKKTATINVPPGVFSGMKKVYEGEGDDGEFGGATGDLIVYFDVETHSFYQRANTTSDDVYCRVTVPFPLALLGGQIEVPSMYGDKTLFVKLDPLTQHEQLYKVQDEGFYSISKQKKGDLYVQICLAVPKALDDEEKELLKKLSKKPNFKSLFKAL